ncbi:hypothetical protein CYLTODRAFT_409949 [Cylindrobasidium torrendii FP15055 ss-10]|uniref:Uncharacterized protein n=1 Tax=Cylindrobasidium torrendii FP15055 ss-10 TaxID=1314674 RepID=A0A0D7BFX0_9AGAR|nr:hypothetical protein CYLTODRAFT_409949 [Cylindrobasidium torrendii FP15055 ss-10]
MLSVPPNFAISGPVRPDDIPRKHPLASAAAEISVAYYIGKSYQSTEAAKHFKSVCRVQFDITWEMDRRTSASQHLERLYARFEDLIWPLVEWGITYLAATFENGVWRLRTPEEVNAQLESRPRPRPIPLSASVRSSVSSNDREFVDAALRSLTPPPDALGAMGTQVKNEPVSPVLGQRVKNEPVSPVLGQRVKNEPVTPTLPRIKKESVSPWQRNTKLAAAKKAFRRVKKEEPASPKIPSSPPATSSPTHYTSSPPPSSPTNSASSPPVQSSPANSSSREESPTRSEDDSDGPVVSGPSRGLFKNDRPPRQLRRSPVRVGPDPLDVTYARVERALAHFATTNDGSDRPYGDDFSACARRST